MWGFVLSFVDVVPEPLTRRNVDHSLGKARVPVGRRGIRRTGITRIWYRNDVGGWERRSHDRKPAVIVFNRQ